MLEFTSGVTFAGVSFAVVYVIVALDPEQLYLYVISELDTERTDLGYRDAVLRWPFRFGVSDLGCLWRWLGDILCG